MAKGQIKQAQAKIDQKTFELLCKCQCVETEISAEFGVSRDTLIRWCKETYGVDFATIYKEKRASGFASLRSKQFAEAMKGNTTLLIFLGKNYLGQSDKVEQETTERIQIINDIPKTENR